MAQFTAFKCDVCGAIGDNRDRWLVLKTYADNRESNGKDICSNDCLIRLGKERQVAGAGVNKVFPTAKRNGKRSTYTPEFRAEVVEAMKTMKAKDVSEMYGVPVSVIYTWSTHFRTGSREYVGQDQQAE